MMLAGLQPPVLSDVDPAEGGEGSIDPLLLAGVYERLANRIAPKLTVRMQRVRFLTAIAAGAKVCECFEPDEVASDGVTPPWLVFEWSVAESLVRCSGELGTIRGMAGRLKVEAALKTGRAISAATYLHTPKIFGFTGIYKTVAAGLGIVTDDLDLEEGGDELLRAWEEDQGLRGFRAGSAGPGAELREKLRRIVRRGLQDGCARRLSGKRYEQIARAFWPDSPGPSEARVLRERLGRTKGLEDPADPVAVHMRREILEGLEAGKRFVDFDHEAAFLRELKRKASPALATRLEAVDVYEGLCVPMNRAFVLLRHAATTAGWVRLEELGASDELAALAATTRRAAQRLGEYQVLLDWEKDLHALVQRFGEVTDGASLLRAVVEHHEESQRKKPPDGKRPWLERAPDGRILVRPNYAVAERPEETDRYLHDYRTPTLGRFLADLGRLPS